MELYLYPDFSARLGMAGRLMWLVVCVNPQLVCAIFITVTLLKWYIVGFLQ